MVVVVHRGSLPAQNYHGCPVVLSLRRASASPRYHGRSTLVDIAHRGSIPNTSVATMKKPNCEHWIHLLRIAVVIEHNMGFLFSCIHGSLSGSLYRAASGHTNGLSKTRALQDQCAPA